jgi:hypothetical protein
MGRKMTYVFSLGGTGDFSSCVAMMLELLGAHGFKHAVIFLFSTDWVT